MDLGLSLTTLNREHIFHRRPFVKHYAELHQSVGAKRVMKPRNRRTAVSSLLLLVSLALQSTAYSMTCDMLSINIDDARTKLRRAARETDLEAAKDYARRAKRALDDSAMSAMDCECDMAYMEFDTAASRARRARDADSGDEFMDSLNRAIRAFNSALDALQTCAAGRK